jgi:hypothetical protein
MKLALLTLLLWLPGCDSCTDISIKCRAIFNGNAPTKAQAQICCREIGGVESMEACISRVTEGKF